MLVGMGTQIVAFRHDALDQGPEYGVGQEIAREEERALAFVPGQFAEDSFAPFCKTVAGEDDGQPPGRSRPADDAPVA